MLGAIFKVKSPTAVGRLMAFGVLLVMTSFEAFSRLSSMAFVSNENSNAGSMAMVRVWKSNATFLITDLPCVMSSVKGIHSAAVRLDP
jgi:hypothetical protein